MKQMAAEEIIVLDDDLEEGEITDDVVPEVEILVQRKETPKQLPRRYNLHDKGPNGRHKICKHKEKNKIQSPSKLETVHRKKHKSSCPRHSFEKHRLKRKDVHHGYDSSAIKSAFRNYTSPPRVPPLSGKFHSYQNAEDESSFPKLLSEYKKAKERLNQKSENVQNHQVNSSQKNDQEQILNDAKKSNVSPTKKDLCQKLPFIDLTEEKSGKESADEDVEELRRIALATCAKKPTVTKIKRKNSIEISSSCSNNASSSPRVVPLIHSVETFRANCDKVPRDNYDVVDMDLDDEEEASSQNICHTDLFVIDKTPAVTEFTSDCLNDQSSKSSQKCSFPEVNENNVLPDHSQPIDDFEELLLRAEVIASMNSSRQKCRSPPNLTTPVEEKVSEIIAKVDMLHNEVSSLNNGIRPKPPCSIFPKGPFKKTVIPPQKRIIDAKTTFSNFKNNKITASPPPRGVNTVQERLIITLNNDTTTDESEEEETNKNVNSQNNVPVSSIEALISSARQKSDEARLNSGSSINVSCLSKAQQEEYNSLKKLLAEKTQYSVPVPLVKERNQTDQSHINLLIKKISVAKANLEKEIGMKTEIQKELLEKKKNYMASKLRVQMLKEKLHAAEKIRAANLENWKQCSAKLDVVKKSVSKRETLLKSLETELTTKNAKPTIPAI